MADRRHEDINYVLTTIRDRAVTGQNDRSRALRDIEVLATKALAAQGSEQPEKPSPVIPKREPAPEGQPVAASVGVTAEETRLAAIRPAGVQDTSPTE